VNKKSTLIILVGSLVSSSVFASSYTLSNEQTTSRELPMSKLRNRIPVYQNQYNSSIQTTTHSVPNSLSDYSRDAQNAESIFKSKLVETQDAWSKFEPFNEQRKSQPFLQRSWNNLIDNLKAHTGTQTEYRKTLGEALKKTKDCADAFLVAQFLSARAQILSANPEWNDTEKSNATARLLEAIESLPFTKLIKENTTKYPPLFKVNQKIEVFHKMFKDLSTFSN